MTKHLEPAIYITSLLYTFRYIAHWEVYVKKKKKAIQCNTIQQYISHKPAISGWLNTRVNNTWWIGISGGCILRPHCVAASLDLNGEEGTTGGWRRRRMGGGVQPPDTEGGVGMEKATRRSMSRDLDPGHCLFLIRVKTWSIWIGHSLCSCWSAVEPSHWANIDRPLCSHVAGDVWQCAGTARGGRPMSSYHLHLPGSGRRAVLQQLPPPTSPSVRGERACNVSYGQTAQDLASVLTQQDVSTPAVSDLQAGHHPRW